MGEIELKTQECITQEAISFFEKFYTKYARVPSFGMSKLKVEEMELLEEPFEKEEVKEEIFSMAKDNSPDPDGFSMLFYQEC